MQTRYDNIDLVFSMEGYTFRALNIVFEQFQRAIPRHSHSDGSYEIHYIPYGHGEVVLNGEKHDLSENALYVTGPHVEHEQFSDPHNPMAEYCIYLSAARGHGEHREQAANTAGRDRLVRLFLDKPLWIGTDTQNLRLVMQQLFSELEKRRTGYLEEVECLLRQCIIRMVRNYERPEDAGPETALAIDLFNSKPIVLEECFLYEYNTLTLEILSSRLGLSRRRRNAF
jgi:mannose-6-phosphate isomerase-like protein (cupin superfamily)